MESSKSKLMMDHMQWNIPPFVTETHKIAQDAFFNKDALRKRSSQAAHHSAGM
jgi:hypothetical protein